MKSTYLPSIAAKMNKFAKLDQNEYFYTLITKMYDEKNLRDYLMVVIKILHVFVWNFNLSI